MNLWDIVISALILGALALAVGVLSDKNRSDSGCGGDCSNCLKSCGERQGKM